MTAQHTIESTQRLETLIGNSVVRMLVDLGSMTSYEPEARTAWAKALGPMRSQISVIYFIGDAPPLVKMGASAVALAIAVPMKFVEDMGDVPRERQTLLDET